MKTFVSILPVVALAAAGVTWSACTPHRSATGSPVPAEQRVARGRHLVQHIALCGDCHSPRLPTGAFDESRWLHGSPLGFAPLMEMPWNPAAPAIAGLPGLTDEHVITLLTTGARPGGQAPLPPMPAFGFMRDEAESVVAYLRSLPSPNQP